MAGKRNRWTRNEDEILKKAVLSSAKPRPSWAMIAKHIPGRSSKDCRKRWEHGLNQNLSRGPWSGSEDARLKAAVAEHGLHWALVATKVGKRTSDQCAKRWCDVLDPSLKKSEWTADEDSALLGLYQQLGTAWAKLATHIPGRSALSCRNRACKILVQRGEPRPGSVEAEELRLTMLAQQQPNSNPSSPLLSCSSPMSASGLSAAAITSPPQLNSQPQFIQMSDKDLNSVFPWHRPPSESVGHIYSEPGGWLPGSPGDAVLDSLLVSTPGACDDFSLGIGMAQGGSLLQTLFEPAATTSASELQFDLAPLFESASVSRDQATPVPGYIEPVDGRSDLDMIDLTSYAAPSMSSWTANESLTSSSSSTSPCTRWSTPAEDSGRLTSAKEWLSSGEAKPSPDNETSYTSRLNHMHPPFQASRATQVSARRMSLPALGQIMTMAGDPARVLQMLATEFDADRVCCRTRSTSTNADVSSKTCSGSDDACLTSRNVDSSSSSSATTWQRSYTASEASTLPVWMHTLLDTASHSTNTLETDQVISAHACQTMQHPLQLSSKPDIAMLRLPNFSGDQVWLDNSHNQHGSSRHVVELSGLVRNMADLMANMATLARAISSGGTASATNTVV